MTNLPKKTIEIKVKTINGENIYIIKYPNTGQFIDIETTKARMTGDTYNDLMSGKSTSAQMARFSVDTIAFLSICSPEDLKKDLNIQSFSELDMIHSNALLKTYIKVILPWLIEWELALNSDDESEE